MQHSGSFRVAPFITWYALAHLTVDAACAYLVLARLDLKDCAILCFLIYNAIAFVLQAPIGWLIDKHLNPKLAAIAGLILVGSAFLFWNSLYAALIIVSVGNALFHVGGGSLVLSLKDKRATFSGIYVAPGGMGLAIGSYLSISQFNINPMLFPLILIFFSLVLFFVEIPEFERVVEKKRTTKWSVLIIALILIPVVVRSLIGLSIDFPWKGNPYLIVILTAAIAAGKVFGGIIADRFGLIKVGVGGLLISAPLLAFFPSLPVIGILGIFVLNFTMPVTLVALLSIMPDRRGLTFGLASAALFVGAFPILIGRNDWIKSDSVVFSILLFASFILYAALYFIDIRKPLNTEPHGL